MTEPYMAGTGGALHARPWTLAASAALVLAMGLWANTVEAATSAAPVYSTESAKAEKSLLLDVTRAGARLIAVGDRGHILFSDDQGKSWTQSKVPTRQLLTAVYFVDDKHGWAVGHDAQVLVSADGGVTWTKQFEDLKREAPLLDVWFKDRDNGFAVGAYGALLETTDGGKQWNDVAERLDNEDQLHLNGIAQVKDAGLFIVGEQGTMFRSGDDGQTWQKLEGPYEGSLFGVIGTAQPRTLLAYGLRGNLYRSTDFGDNWQKIELQGARGALEFGLASATLLDDGSLVLVGNGGSVLRSTDDGQTFSVFNRSDRIALAGVTGKNGGGLVLVGQGGVHLASAQGAEGVQP
ncbi:MULTISPECIES: WD40/YVTN/BNR-like repeat-containing protein [Pseudomonas]|uniref:YCF48-related protein n=1 Tax=Pseudomonas auratipiscis TaxID=3115853 RepID=A0AB35X1E4_9PSED|nr:MULTISPECIES: YCF48-related protein [unclassified Pseudomonas]MEE1869653.1 YCF48-related protein [Pseudomonas sp. 120P]MEE1960542.1 YCF48-related protein [Pseudomonas sp. 119P]